MTDPRPKRHTNIPATPLQVQAGSPVGGWCKEDHQPWPCDAELFARDAERARPPQAEGLTFEEEGAFAYIELKGDNLVRAHLAVIHAALLAERARPPQAEHDDRHPLDGSTCHASRLHVHRPDGTVEWKS